MSTLGAGHHIVWFRRDLRVGENPAWAAATQMADAITALYVLDPSLFDSAGPFRRAALASNVHALDRQLRARGGCLRIETGRPGDVVAAVAADLGADAVHWNNDTTPYAARRDTTVHQALKTKGIDPLTHWGTLVHQPGTVLSGKGTLSKVFTPFSKVWFDTPWAPWASGEGAATVAALAGSTDAAALRDRVEGAAAYAGGEVAARARLAEFLDRIDAYLDRRDLPAVEGTSMLSADLRFGTLSPREVADAAGDSTAGRRGFVRQLAWRDWYAHLLGEYPTMPHAAIKPEYDAIEWRNDEGDFEAWTQGRTGFPIVDAGMRQLSVTGWMHNRVRMIVGSFLVKHLLIDWRRGERWFRHLLVDADVSQNVGNWQWVAGSGTDAAPYFRVFNPWIQSRKFDAAGDYLRMWVPELARLDNNTIHEPTTAAPLELAAAGVVLGDTYPYPMIDHAFARDRALATFKAALKSD